MGIHLLRARTPGTRHRSVSDFSNIKKFKNIKKLTFSFKKTSGRNNRGVITCRHRGGGHKRLYRLIDFNRNKIGISCRVINISYNSYSNARIALVRYTDGEYRYIICPLGLKIGTNLISNIHAPISIGNSLPLRNIPLGTKVHNVEFSPGSKSGMARSAGSYLEVLSKEGDYVSLRLPSKEIRNIHKNSWATIGIVGNIDSFLIKIGKAGRNRWLGKRPSVRGSAMNPVDHPHGGGEGRSPIGRKHPVTPWGKPALGVLTRKPKKYSNKFIISYN